jgi:predicted O-methyltransferase YrrM
MSLLFTFEYPKDIKPTVKYVKDKCKVNYSQFVKFNDIFKKVKQLEQTDKDVQYLYDMTARKGIKLDGTHYAFTIFHLNKKDTVLFFPEHFGDEKKCCKFYNWETRKPIGYTGEVNRKFKKLMSNMFGEEIYQAQRPAKVDDCKRQRITYIPKLQIIYHLFEYLELGGSFMINVKHYCDCMDFEIFYLLSLLFKRVTICDGSYYYGEDFLGEERINKETVKKMLTSNFKIEPKPKFDEYVRYLQEIFKNKTKHFELMLKKDEDAFLQNLFTFYEKLITEMNVEDSQFLYNQIYHSIIEKFRRTIVGGKIKKIHSAIKKEEGENITKLMKKYDLKKCIEVGMAFGISATYILTGNKNASLISIDPFQSTQWENYGMKLLKEFKIEKNHKLMEEKSYIALPKILMEHGEESFDFVFIDGWHTFEMTNIDFFYATHLIKKGGIILVDDALHSSVAQSIRFFDSNYPHFKKLDVFKTQVAYQKIGEDERPWNYYSPF